MVDPAFDIVFYMLRRSRIHTKGVQHHIIARGIERCTISNDDQNRYDFLKTFVVARILLITVCFGLTSCSVVRTTYDLTAGTLKLGYEVTRFAGKTVYVVGKYTYIVVKAPLSWPLTNENIQTIDGLPPSEAIRRGRVKTSPYVVNGHRYVPMSVKAAQTYSQVGIASWYGNETYQQQGGRMTADGEAFNPNALSAAHKYLPLPTFVRVTNLENGRHIIVRVNDRGPFVRGRIIDVSAAAAKMLGFYRSGTAEVRVETVHLKG